MQLCCRGARRCGDHGLGLLHRQGRPLWTLTSWTTRCPWTVLMPPLAFSLTCWWSLGCYCQAAQPFVRLRLHRQTYNLIRYNLCESMRVGIYHASEFATNLPAARSTWARIMTMYPFIWEPKTLVDASMSHLGAPRCTLSASSCLWSFIRASACQAKTFTKD